MANFTPGPWYATEHADFLRIREEASDYIIATTEDGGHPEIEVFDHSTQVANARLIAAAPAMLAALQAFVKQWNACGPNSDFGRYFQPVRDKAVAAIAAASGEGE